MDASLDPPKHAWGFWAVKYLINITPWPIHFWCLGHPLHECQNALSGVGVGKLYRQLATRVRKPFYQPTPFMKRLWRWTTSFALTSMKNFCVMTQSLNLFKHSFLTKLIGRKSHQNYNAQRFYRYEINKHPFISVGVRNIGYLKRSEQRTINVRIYNTEQLR